MTNETKIYGYSDDLVELESNQGNKEYYANRHGQVKLTVEDGLYKAFIYGDYRDNGVWSISLFPYDEGYEIPDRWNARITTDMSLCYYSAVLVLELSDRAKISQIDEEY